MILVQGVPAQNPETGQRTKASEEQGAAHLEQRIRKGAGTLEDLIDLYSLTRARSERGWGTRLLAVRKVFWRALNVQLLSLSLNQLRSVAEEYEEKEVATKASRLLSRILNWSSNERLLDVYGTGNFGRGTPQPTRRGQDRR